MVLVVNIQLLVRSSGITCISAFLYIDIDTLCSEKPNGRNVAKMLSAARRTDRQYIKYLG